VGAVLVRDGAVVGEGATQPYGGPHAEPVALAAAGARARGATLYVTLEPCSHYGKTPPCTDAVIAAGVRDVRVATLDPNPRVAGNGVRLLHEAGIPAAIGEGAAAARALNEDFAVWITTGRPHVTAKFACSLDGRIATRTGDSRWITGPEARAEVHLLRDRVDAILAGVGTVLADDPELTTRIARPARPTKNPGRVVLDSTCRTPLPARLLQMASGDRVAVYTTERAPADRRRALEDAGAVVRVLPSSDGRVPIEAVLADLGRERVTSVLVEGGATVHGAFFDAGLVDRVLAFVAPVVIGGRDAPGAVAGHGPALLRDTHRLLDPEVRLAGVDTLIAGSLRRAAWPDP
jgi:diaminohydroxyphosphoribosylaminopyrimidine deaminase/5-amino-6-(5-phosphoribosylamino)uracil reductase